MGCGRSESRFDGTPGTSAGRVTGEAPSWADDQLVEVRASVDISAAATGRTASSFRREFAAWLAVDLPAGELFDDLVLVVYEVLANAADHAYTHQSGGAGPVRLLARRSRRAIHITVSDRGTWRGNRATSGAPDLSDTGSLRGRGLPLVRLLVEDTHVEVSAAGTIVHLRTGLPAPAGQQPG